MFLSTFKIKKFKNKLQKSKEGQVLRKSNIVFYKFLNVFKMNFYKNIVQKQDLF